MASFLSGLGSLIGIGADIYSAYSGANAAEDAASVQQQSSAEAIALGREGLQFQKDVYNIGRADQSPYRASGSAALGTLNNMFIPGGNSMVQMQGQLNDLRAQRAQLAGGGGGYAGAGGGGQAQMQQLRSIWDRARGGSGGGGSDGGDERRAGGYDQDHGAGTFDGTFMEWAARVGPIIGAIAGGPVGMLGYGLNAAYDYANTPGNDGPFPGEREAAAQEAYNNPISPAAAAGYAAPRGPTYFRGSLVSGGGTVAGGGGGGEYSSERQDAAREAYERDSTGYTGRGAR